MAALIEGVAAFVWFGWGQADPPHGLAPLLGVGSGLGLVMAIAGAIVARRSPAGSTPMADPAIRRRNFIIVGVEFGALVVGAIVLAALGQPDYVPVWVCAGVGIHFFPLATTFGSSLLQPVGALLVVVAVGALVVGLTTSSVPGTVTGVGAGVLLLISGALRLAGIGIVGMQRPGAA